MIHANSEDRIVVVERVAVGDGSLEAFVRVPDDRFLRTSVRKDLVERVFSVAPGLERHRCDCGVPHGIRAELADTETAHLVEHLALEFMVMAGSPRTLAGETRWDSSADGRGVFHVRLEYDDERVALGALALAARTASALVTGGPLPGVTEETRRIGALRSEQGSPSA